MSRSGAGAASRVLVVEDESEIAGLIAYQLTRQGHRVETALTGAAALDALHRNLPDLVVLDRMLPDVSGDEVLKSVRSDPDTREVPVLVLTAKREEEDRITGLEMGADDYLTKPFSPRELVLRVDAILRRARGEVHSDSGGQIMQSGGLKLDLGAKQVTRNGEPLHLTRIEFRLLRALMARRGRTRSRDQLLADMWETRIDMVARVRTRTVDMHVRRLRGKLGAEGDRIETVRGFGYRFRRAAEAEPKS